MSDPFRTVLCLSVVVSLGCVTLPGVRSNPPPGPPAQLVALAQVARTSPDAKSPVEIVAQVAFLDTAMRTTPAAGSMSFFAYLDGDPTNQRVEPSVVWRFAPQEVLAHQTGRVDQPSYSFALPIGEKTAATKTVFLVCRHDTLDGRRLVSHVRLTDQPPKSNVEHRKIEPVQPASLPDEKTAQKAH